MPATAALESARIASDLLRDAKRELAHEELDPCADDLTIALARQRVFLARRRLLATRHVLGYEDDLACDGG